MAQLTVRNVEDTIAAALKSGRSGQVLFSEGLLDSSGDAGHAV